MASEEELHSCFNEKQNQDSDLHSRLHEKSNQKFDFHSCFNMQTDQNFFYLKKFRLYETPSNYYMIGRDKSRTCWRVLKIDRSEPTELNIVEDPTTYSEQECYELLRRIHEGNKPVGGLKLITVCYGIIGFVRFLGPYYMLIITQRRKLGAICGHTIYGISKSKMIPVPNSTVRSKLPYSKDENRYKKLLCTVDLTKDFYFSYSYHVMRSLQKNLRDYKTGDFVYETMFVWNEFLTREIRNNLKNTLWTVALVYGFFKQVDLSISGKEFKFTLIARRSRHYAGTRYLKRGVNEKGRVANDVETEQIVSENSSEGCPTQISSIVQIRGSIPLFWSQDSSPLIVRPDIQLSRKDHKYEATRLHFENLVNRYGNPIIILNLIKTREKKPRETILRAEFANAIRFINRSFKKERHIRFLQWDLHKHSRCKATSVLAQLETIAKYALSLTGIFYCQVAPNSNAPCFEEKSSVNFSSENLSSQSENADNQEIEICNGSCVVDTDASGNYSEKTLMFQKGVLRTNCIDCLDRTNVAQYSYGLVALGSQLHTLGLINSPKIDLNNPLADQLMRLYETMGDILAFQYGGSAAHNKIFSERRGQWKPATQSQELFRTFQRYCNNTYWDGEKQNAINVFLGHFQPQPGKPALWELGSDQHHNFGRHDSNFAEKYVRLFIKRSLSDGNIQSDTPMASTVGCNQPLSEKAQGVKGLSDSTPVIPTCENDLSYCGYFPSMSRKQFFRLMQEEQSLDRHLISYDEDEECNLSGFMDSDWLSTSGNSCEEETYERSPACLSSENVVDGLKIELTKPASKTGSSVQETEQPELSRDGDFAEFSESFVNWVCKGGLLFR
ncbi:phosphoinositide phosphatase SAC2 isoform X1 [Morus notabilis]|uniref:phosphoinositide phosphatase SAC2 isoform X1 n=1 Tax=Morus notabilis TaxID=981085 RepID=UPI000CED6F88|nr:phosphoinositide phosphatase SAC2 isoform X1 [Morus notabilis]XP_024024533.1 phosphoinositide phosphatase SAC2 isoform X1 [Morus notabilis]